ncbi:MAG: hypothetical protein J6Q31_06375 [Alistipes sp.]|nr:hypothetical protein [Alistipes sp.]
MIRKLIVALFFSAFTLTAMAQVNNGQRIAITPAVCDDLPLPAEAKKALGQKLLQMTTQNGFGASAGPFVLTANVHTVEKVVSTTIPPQFIIDLEVSAYVVNLSENIIAAETSFEVRGMDVSESRSLIKAINQINAKSPVVRSFMSNAREKIIDYYSGRVPTIIAKAQSLADRGEYEEAIATLAAVPESLEEYPLVVEKMTATYTQMVDKFATMALQDAKGKIALKDYPGALDVLMSVDPSSTRFEEATKMVDSIKRTIDEKERAEMQARLEKMQAQQELAQKMHDDEVMLQKMQIEASKKNAQEQIHKESAGEKLQNSLSKWLFGNL